MRSAAAVLIAAILPLAPAQAQSDSVDVETSSRADSRGNGSWTGFYVGGRLGYAFSGGDDNDDELLEFDTNLDGTFGDTVRTLTGTDAFSPGFCAGPASTGSAAGGCPDDDDGTDWAVHAGFDFDLGGLVVGAVGEYGRTNIDDSASGFSSTPASYTLTRALDDHYAFRGRAGFKFRDMLVYATGGAINAKVEQSFTTSNAANVFTPVAFDEREWGYQAGGGVEARTARNFVIGAQYLFTSVKPDDLTVRVSRGTSASTNPFILANGGGTDLRRTNRKFEWHSVHVTAGFRF